MPTRLVEIACDESGYEGEKLIGTTTDVFAHASVQLDTGSAAACIQELRDRIRSPATEYKANHLLREKHRAVLTWLLGPCAPLHENAHVYLIDKQFYVVATVVDLLLADDVTDASGVGRHQNHRAKGLYREGRQAFGRDQWAAFLVSSNNLLRVKDRLDTTSSVERFFHAVDALRRAGTPGPVDETLELLWQARPHADAFRAQLRRSPTMMSALDPLIPAIVRAVAHWGAAGRPVAIVHDRQNTLSLARIAQLTELVSKRSPASADSSPRGRLASLSLVDSASNPGVQIGDILAGVAGKIAADELNGRGDAQLTALLRPYVDRCSTWGDDRSWPG